jgi:DNA-directed RNA polymerase specialized sigma subunit
MKEMPEEEDYDQKIISNEFLDKVMSIIDNYKDQRISKIFKMRYIDASTNKVTPWKQIGDSLNLSIQGCINIHNKTISKIKKELSKDI